MSKSKHIKLPAKELSAGFTIKLPEKLRADEVTIVSIEDGCTTMNVQPCTIHVAKVVGSYGPFKSIEATILLDSNGDVIVTKEPEKSGLLGRLFMSPVTYLLVVGASFLGALPYV